MDINHKDQLELNKAFDEQITKFIKADGAAMEYLIDYMTATIHFNNAKVNTLNPYEPKNDGTIKQLISHNGAFNEFIQHVEALRVEVNSEVEES